MSDRLLFSAIKTICAATLIASLAVAPAALACWTPLEWQAKPVEWNRDQDRNGIDDSLDERIATDKAVPAPVPAKVPVVVNLTRCPTAADISWLSQYGTIVKQGRYVTFVALEDVDAADLPTIANHSVVAFIEEMQGFQASLDVSGAAIKVRSSTVYPQNLEDLAPLVDGSGTTIAIIDSGIDDQDGAGTTHEMFPSGKFVGGYIVGTGLGNPNDTNGHGTHVAGIAAGVLSSGTQGYRGMAPAADLVDCQTTLQCGPPSWLDVIECFEQLITNQPTWQVDVVNLSLRQCNNFGQTITTDGTDAASQMANQVVSRGITVVAAAGNDGPNNTGLTSPCAADNAICVAAMDDQNTVTRTDDVIANFSSRGPRADDGDLDGADETKPDVSAPGVAIIAANNDTVSGYVSLSGTSMASPHVAGLAALVRQMNPGINPGSVKNLIIQTSEDWGTPGWNADSGHGYVDAWATINATAQAEPGYPNHGSYPQPWLCSDITTASPPVVGVPNTLTAVVYNSSNNVATDVEVTFGVHIYSTGIPDFYSIGAQTVTVPANSQVSVSHPWTPQPSPTGNPHACLKTTINYGFDTNFGNNNCQRNISINQTNSPVEFTFQIQNTTHEAITLDLTADPQLEFPGPLEGDETYVMLPGERIFAFDRWTETLETTRVALEPTDCAQDVTLTLVVDDDATPADGALISVPAIATTERGEQILLGGVTAYGHTPCPPSWGDDEDGDAICGDIDNCPSIRNPEQMDSDGDGIGDICDESPYTGNETPCTKAADAAPYEDAYTCIEQTKNGALKAATRTSASAETTRAEAAAVVVGDIMSAKLDYVQIELCRKQAVSSATRLEAMQEQVTVLEKIGRLTPEGATQLRQAYADCAADIRRVK